MATQPIVTKNLVSQMISLLDTLYHWGVRDSHALCDEGAAREFLESHSETNVYGFLTDTCPISALEWQLRLIQQARLTSMFGSMYQYFTRMGRFSANYLSVFIPLAQRGTIVVCRITTTIKARRTMRCLRTASGHSGAREG